MSRSSSSPNPCAQCSCSIRTHTVRFTITVRFLKRRIHFTHFASAPPIPSLLPCCAHRVNSVRAPLAYKARPHNGIWATPPYLHNGAIPNLFELLSPVSERSKTFYLGNKEYDPVKLGLDVAPLEGASKIDVSLPGNSNAGHEFNDGLKGNGVIGRKLTEEERMQIIEYLKTL